jgi:hypothetical protein
VEQVPPDSAAKKSGRRGVKRVKITTTTQVIGSTAVTKGV